MRVETAVEEYKTAKKNAGDETVVNYSHRLQPFLDFCEKYGFENVRDLTARRVAQYKKERVNHDIGPVTLEQQLRTLRDFLRWGEKKTALRRGLDEQATIEAPTF
jgi:site-specific recombinase XerD